MSLEKCRGCLPACFQGNCWFSKTLQSDVGEQYLHHSLLAGVGGKGWFFNWMQVVRIWLHFCILPHTGDAGSNTLGSAFVLSAWSGSGEDASLRGSDFEVWATESEVTWSCACCSPTSEKCAPGCSRSVTPLWDWLTTKPHSLRICRGILCCQIIWSQGLCFFLLVAGTVS